METELAKLEILKLMGKDSYGMRSQKDGWAKLLHEAPEAFLHKDVWLSGFKAYGGEWMQTVPKPSRDVLVEAAVQNLRYFVSDLLREKEFVMEVYATANSRGKSIGRSSLNNLTTELKKDKEVVLLAVENDGSNYLCSSRARNIREDEDIVKAAIADDPHLYSEIPAQFRSRKDIVLLAVKKNPSILSEIPQFYDDIDVMTAAVERVGNALSYACYRLKLDRELCLKAVLNNTEAMAHVPEKFREDVEFSIHCNSSKKVTDFLKYCGSLRNDPAFVEMAIESNFINYSYASYNDRLKEEIYLPMLERSNGEGYKLLPDVLREDLKLFYKCFKLAATGLSCEDEDAQHKKSKAIADILVSAPPAIQMILIDEAELRRAQNLPREVMYEQSIGTHWHFYKYTNSEFVEKVVSAEKRLDTYMLNEKLSTELTQKSRSKQLLRDASTILVQQTQQRPARQKI